MLLFKEYLEEGKRGLWDNIHAKQKRIKAGSGEHMRKPGSKGAPTAAALKASQTNEELDEAMSPQQDMDFRKMMSGAMSRDAYNAKWKKPLKSTSKVIYGKNIKEELTADDQFDLIESVVEELAFINNVDPEILWEQLESLTDEELLEYAVDAKGHKSSTGGLTQKGRDAYNAKGAHLQAPVTTPPSKLKAGSKAANRRKSFCARMSGMEGPMKKPNGEPTRKALALRKWNC